MRLTHPKMRITCLLRAMLSELILITQHSLEVLEFLNIARLLDWSRISVPELLFGCLPLHLWLAYKRHTSICDQFEPVLLLLDEPDPELEVYLRLI